MRAPAAGCFIVLVAIAAGVGLGGCGDHDPKSTEVQTPRTLASSETHDTTASATVTDSYRGWLAALAAQDAAAACTKQAPELTIELRQQAILEQRAELGDPCVGFESLLWEDPTLETVPVQIEVTQLTDEDALLAVDFPEVDQSVRMIYHRAKWLVADTSPRTDDEQNSATQRWLDAWCDLDSSMTRAEVIDLMGAPSGEYTLTNGGEPQLWWAQGQYDFRVYLEPDGSIYQLVGDYDALSATDRSLLTCPELR